ncbi:MAG: sugar transferase [Spirochaetota bacterium]
MVLLRGRSQDRPILFSPVMVISAAMIRLSTRGPIIFTQRRAGWRGREFTIYKFRTMTTDAEQRKSSLRQFSEQDGPAFKMTNDPRVTCIGRFLRATSLDELPQFWNVLIGNMSLVGPRPLPVEEADACSQWQRRRLDVVPGLTCIWQVSGRSEIPFDRQVELDVAYIQSQSLWLDIVLLLKTIPAVVFGKGAY